jgi:hypothetical protein
MSAGGGDERNPFGLAFANAGMMFTPMLRAQFPDRFVYPVSKVSQTLTIHFSDPGNRQLVVESEGTRNLVDVERRTVNGAQAAAPRGTAPEIAAGAAAVVAQVAGEAEVPVDDYSREGAFFGANVVNLPNGKPIRAGGVDFFIGHRFFQDIKAAGFGGLFGLDSSATVAFSGRVGVTNWLSFGVMRSNYFKNRLDRTPIELNTTLQMTRQSASMPITLQARAGVEGSRNFHALYRPFLQFVATRTFADRVSVTLVPTFAFNTLNESSHPDRVELPPELLFGEEHKHTQSLGVGVGIRFRPTVSIVGEYIPRLHGFGGEFKDYAGLSVGLQKSTFRHTFELVVGRQPAMTTAQYAFQGADTFRIGFNIFRRLR